MSGYSRVVSQHLPEFMGVLTDIINHNGIRVNYLLRASVNAIEPLITNPVVSVDHVDHEFPHQNLIIYLTDAGGATHCEGYTHDPCEDDIIQFKGMHCHDLPLNKRRVVFVATYA